MYLCRWLNPSAQSTCISIYVSADEIMSSAYTYNVQMYLCRWLNPSAQSTWVSMYVSADDISHLYGHVMLYVYA